MLRDMLTLMLSQLKSLDLHNNASNSYLPYKMAYWTVADEPA